MFDASGLADAPPPSRQQAPDGPRHRILVVDDDRDAADSLALLLRLWGHAVHVAYHGPGALEAAAAYRPEVVLLDMVMPGMTGYEVADRLRREPGLGKAVLIALTGLGQDEDHRRSREAGFTSHLVKPAEPAELRQLLAGLVTPAGTA